MLNPKLAAYFDDYATYHQHPVNRLIHKIAIPVIVFHILAMLDWIALFSLPGVGWSVSAGHLFGAAAFLWFLTLDVPLALVMFGYGVICFALAAWTPVWAVVAVAVVAWIIQFMGHFIWERKAPAFFENLLQTLIGPLFFAAILLRRWPQRSTST